MRTILIVMAAVVLIGTAVYLSGPATVYTIDSHVIALAKPAEGIVFVSAAKPDAKAGSLQWVAGRRQRPQTLSTPGQVVAVAAEGVDVWAVVADPPALVHYVLPSPRPADTISCPYRPLAAAIRDGTLVWVERRPAVLPCLKHIPVAGPVDIIRALRSGRQQQVLAVVEGTDSWQRHDIIATAGGRLYWAQHVNPQVAYPHTLFCSVSLEGSDLPRVEEVEAGHHSAILYNGNLYWTAYSKEAAQPDSLRSVWQRPLAGGQPSYVTDWLSPPGPLVASKEHIYYFSIGTLWAVPPQLGWPRDIWSAPRGSIKAWARAPDGLYAACPFTNPRARTTKVRVIRIPTSLQGRVKNIFRKL